MLAKASIQFDERADSAVDAGLRQHDGKNWDTRPRLAPVHRIR
jgi:hypothetical protein